MVEKDVRLAKWKEFGNTCALAVMYNEWAKEMPADIKDSKRYNVSKAHKELYGEPEGTNIRRDTLLRPDFRMKIKSSIKRYATLKTREYYWAEYTDFQKLEYWHDTPVIYRLQTEQEGIKVPEMTKDWARLLIEETFWRIKYNDMSLKKVRKGSFVESVPVPKGIKREIERRVSEMVGRGWVL